jgi:hypothetical protein
MKAPGPSEHYERPQQHWPTPAAPPKGSPNIVLMMLDDVGFADFGCYGSEIATPSIDSVAKRGMRYSGFHTTGNVLYNPRRVINRAQSSRCRCWLFGQLRQRLPRLSRQNI